MKVCWSRQFLTAIINSCHHKKKKKKKRKALHEISHIILLNKLFLIQFLNSQFIFMLLLVDFWEQRQVFSVKELIQFRVNLVQYLSPTGIDITDAQYHGKMFSDSFEIMVMYRSIKLLCFLNLYDFNLEMLQRHKHERFGLNNMLIFATFLCSIQSTRRLHL